MSESIRIPEGYQSPLGMKETQMRQIGTMIARHIDEGEAAVPEVKEQVIALCEQFPLYPEIG